MKIAQTGYWAVGFVALMLALGIAGGSLGLWQALDHRIFASLQRLDPVRPDPGIRIIDIEYSEDLRQSDRPETFRASIAAVLRAIAAGQAVPQTVVIDVWFSNNPAGIEPIMSAIAALRARGVRVIGAFNPSGRHGALSTDPMRAHHQALYRGALDDYGHVLLEYAFGVMKYERELPLPVKAGDQVIGQTSVYALPLVATLESSRIAALPASIVVPLGEDALFERQIHRIRSGDAMPLRLPPVAGARIIVLCSLVEDSDNPLSRPGPLLLAWAMSDLLAGRTSAAPVPLNRPLASVLLGLLGAFVSWVVFSATFAGMRSRVSPPGWTSMALVLALIACLIGLMLLALTQALLLASGRVAPLAWPIACVLCASLLAMASGWRWISDTRSRLTLERGTEEQAIAYDVFVSYAHDPTENRNWVRSHVVEPLAKLRRADGRPIRIFFDERSIQPGRQWKREIELALLGTCCFIPVYSERYFDRPYCREEIELADQLRIEGRLGFVPVARITIGIPERFLRKVQYLDASIEPEIAAVLTERVKELIDRAGPAPSADAAARA